MSIPIEGVSLVVDVNGIDVVDDTGRPVVVKIVSEHGWPWQTLLPFEQ